jgi:hypothetical protein
MFTRPGRSNSKTTHPEKLRAEGPGSGIFGTEKMEQVHPLSIVIYIYNIYIYVYIYMDKMEKMENIVFF